MVFKPNRTFDTSGQRRYIFCLTKLSELFPVMLLEISQRSAILSSQVPAVHSSRRRTPPCLTWRLQQEDLPREPF